MMLCTVECMIDRMPHINIMNFSTSGGKVSLSMIQGGYIESSECDGMHCILCNLHHAKSVMDELGLY